MVRVLVFGTFDIFHKGHEHLLLEAKKLGDELVVVVARDSTVLEVKGRKAVNSQEERLKRVAADRQVNLAVLGCEGDKYDIVEELKPDIICLGYDQTHFTQNLAGELAKRGLNARIVRIGSFMPETFKSSKLRG